MSGFKYPETSLKEGIAFSRANLQDLHEGKGVDGKFKGNMLPDAEMAHLFGCSAWEVSYARKHSAYWEGKPEKDTIEHDNGQITEPKLKKKKKEL